MSPNKRMACFLGGMLWMAVASTLGGCASVPPSTAPSADNAAMAQSMGDARNSLPEEPDLWHLLRNAAVDLYDAGLAFNPFLEGPIHIQLTGGR
jgi:outer membrane protein TolC